MANLKLNLKLLLGLVILSIFVTGTIINVFAAEKVLLEFKYKMGEKIKYSINMNGVTKMETAAKKGDAKVEVKMQVEQSVLFINKKNGNIDIQTKILSGTAKNAEGKDEDLTNVGNTVYMTIAKNGELLGATSYDANYDPISVSMSFPKEAIPVGHTWKTEVKQPIPMILTYKLKEIKKHKNRNCAVIEQITTVGADVKNVDAKGTGLIYFDLDKGYVITNETQIDMVMNQEIENDTPALGPAKKKVKTTVNLSTKMELSE